MLVVTAPARCAPFDVGNEVSNEGCSGGVGAQGADGFLDHASSERWR